MGDNLPGEFIDIRGDDKELVLDVFQVQLEQITQRVDETLRRIRWETRVEAIGFTGPQSLDPLAALEVHDIPTEQMVLMPPGADRPGHSGEVIDRSNIAADAPPARAVGLEHLGGQLGAEVQ